MTNMHRLTPEQTMLNLEFRKVNEWAWALRKITGPDLEYHIRMRVPENLREDVLYRVRQLQAKHGLIG